MNIKYHKKKNKKNGIKYQWIKTELKRIKVKIVFRLTSIFGLDNNDFIISMLPFCKATVNGVLLININQTV